MSLKYKALEVNGHFIRFAGIWLWGQGITNVIKIYCLGAMKVCTTAVKIFQCGPKRWIKWLTAGPSFLFTELCSQHCCSTAVIYVYNCPTVISPWKSILCMSNNETKNILATFRLLQLEDTLQLSTESSNSMGSFCVWEEMWFHEGTCTRI